MSFFRVSNPNASAFTVADLGIQIAASASNVVLSNQFSVFDLAKSADLESAIIAGNLTVQIDYGTGFASILAIDYTNRDCLAAFLNIYELTNNNDNERLVQGGDASSSTELHHHDTRYWSKSQLAATTGAGQIGADQTNFSVISGATVQAVLDSVDNALAANDLDSAYTRDTDGVLNVNGSGKPLEFRSNGTNNISITRKVGTDSQNALLLNPSINEIQLGSLVQGALAQMNVRVKTNLIVDGDISFTGQITDTTVSNMNVSNNTIILRDGAVTDADASILVKRPIGGTDAQLKWNNSTTRWKAGLAGTEKTMAMLELNEVVTGIYEFQGSAATDPSQYFTNKGAAPTTQLGTSTQIPVAVIGNTLAFYDKSSSRNKWLSVAKKEFVFSGRDSANNTNEYARLGQMTSLQTGLRIPRNMTLVGITIQANAASTWAAEVRKNDVATSLLSLSSGGAVGAQNLAANVDFVTGDEVQVYINGSGVNRPVITLELAERF